MRRKREADSICLTLDLLPCGRAVIHLLGQIIAVLEDEPNVKALDRAVTIAESLLRLSNEKILSFNYRDVPTCWRRLYTDAIIFKVLAAMMAGKERMEEEWIKDLDMVIIVAGSPGEGRREIVFALIEEAQSSCRSRDDDAHRQKRRRVSTSPASPPPRSLAIPSLSADYPIPILDSLPDFESFLGASQSAFIVRQAASTWPALTDSDHRWSSFDYMRKVAGPHRVVPVEVGGNYTEESWGQKIMPFDDLLDVIDRDTGLEDRLYLAQHDLFRQLPALRNDIIVPELVYASPLSNYETYVPPASEDGYLTNAWLGPEGTVSPPHTDPYFNCYGDSSLLLHFGCFGCYLFSDAMLSPETSSGCRIEMDLDCTSFRHFVHVHLFSHR